MKTHLCGGLSLIAMVAIVPVAEARYITIESQVNARIEDDTARILLTIANKGDEAAHKVKARVEVGGKEAAGLSRDVLEPNDRYAEELRVPVAYSKPGTYPVIVAVDYADANQYPFTAISINDVTYGESLSGRVIGEVFPASLRSSATLNVNVTNLGQATENLRVRLVTPTEIPTATPLKELALKPSKEESVKFKIKNASALPGSQYRVFAIVSYEHDLHHFTNVVGGTITVGEKQDTLEPYKTPLIMIALLAGVTLGYFNLKRLSGRRRTT